MAAKGQTDRGALGTKGNYVQSKRYRICAQEIVDEQELKVSTAVVVEAYHQARRAGLYAVMNTKIWVDGYDKCLRPNLTFITATRRIYALGRFHKPIKDKNGYWGQGRMKAAVNSRKAFNATGYPFMEFYRVDQIPELIRFATNAQYLTSIGEVRDWLSGKPEQFKRGAELAAAERCRQSQSLPVRKGAFIEETGIRGFGKFR